jgi:hypothetical protein
LGCRGFCRDARRLELGGVLGADREEADESQLAVARDEFTFAPDDVVGLGSLGFHHHAAGTRVSRFIGRVLDLGPSDVPHRLRQGHGLDNQTHRSARCAAGHQRLQEPDVALAARPLSDPVDGMDG